MEIFKTTAKDDKRIIWTSEIDFEALESEYAGNIEEYCMDQEIYLGDEKMNLDIRTAGDVIALAANGTRYPEFYGRGTRYGYQELTGNVNSIFRISGDDREFYYDGENVRGTWANHDCFGDVVFRAWRSGISEKARENFLSLFCRGQASYEDMEKVTRSIGPDVAKVYGWKARKSA